jgi:exodeoxyribonuclease-3
LRIVSVNIDGVDRAINSGFFEWLAWQNADIVCLQELNAKALSPRLTSWLLSVGFDVAAAHGTKSRKGSGTAILSRHGFEDINTYDESILSQRGQIVTATIRGLRIASVYVSYGNTEAEREEFGQIFRSLRSQSPLALLAGDFNILAERRDSHLWYAETCKGYRPDERAWFRSILKDWSDAVRIGMPSVNASPLYTWWSNRGTCFGDNRGTRLDYQLASPDLCQRIIAGSARVVRETLHGKRITDHAPLIVDFNV